VTIELESPIGALSKRLTFQADGSVRAEFVWDASAFPAGAFFTTEISTSRPVVLVASGATIWEQPIETVAKSERGLDRTLQGTGYLVRWPVSSGRGRVDLSAT
jgi:hypothetical protein